MLGYQLALREGLAQILASIFMHPDLGISEPQFPRLQNEFIILLLSQGLSEYYVGYNRCKVLSPVSPTLEASPHCNKGDFSGRNEGEGQEVHDIVEKVRKSLRSRDKTIRSAGRYKDGLRPTNKKQ